MDGTIYLRVLLSNQNVLTRSVGEYNATLSAANGVLLDQYYGEILNFKLGIVQNNFDQCIGKIRNPIIETI